jgi:predicted MFS family arabinose efflux permease
VADLIRTDDQTDDPGASTSVPPAEELVGRRNPFAILGESSFRALWFNTVAFVLIQSTQRFAYVWLVLELGGRERQAGIAAFAMGIPILFLSLPAGVLSDRMDRRKLLAWSQLAAFVVSALTAGLILSGRMTITTSYVLAGAMGATTAYGQPVRQAIVPSIVPMHRLQNAIALTTLAMNTSFMIGPALGGALIAWWGIGVAFAVQTAIYGVALLPLVWLKLPEVVKRNDRRLMRDIREGVAFVVKDRGIRVLVALLMVFGLLMIGPFQALLPIIARDNLDRGALGTGALFASLGTGMLVTSLILASTRDLKRKGLIFTVNYIAGGVGFAAIGLSSSYVLTLVILFFWGMGGGLFINLNQTLIQTRTPNELMGRVMSVSTLAFAGIGPIGALIAGGGADALGAATWVALCGAFIAATGIVALATQRDVRELR